MHLSAVGYFAAVETAPRRVAAGTAVWLGVLAGLFMLFTAEWTAADWVGAGACALVAAAATSALVRIGLFDLRFRAGWLRYVPVALLQTVVDFGIVTAQLARCMSRRTRAGGAFVARREFPAGRKDAEGTAWRGFVAVTATLSPNSYVVDIDPDRGNRLSHDLVPCRRSEEPA